MKKTLLLISILFTSCSGKEYRGTEVKPNHPPQQRTISNSFGNYHALLIYVDDYTHLNKLETPKNDVEDISKLLKTRYGFKKTIIVENPKNRKEIVDILDELSEKIGENDNLLIYYAGHGNSQGYWQLQDALPNRRAGWVFIKEVINETLKNMSPRHILVIADSCYSGIMTRDSNARIQGKRDLKYYQELYEKKSRTVLTSGGLEPVLDSDPMDSSHSLFANGLLKTLQKNQKPIFVLEEKFSDIKKYVNSSSAYEQTPQYSKIMGTGHEMGGDFIFVDKSVNYTSAQETTTPIPTAIVKDKPQNRKSEMNKYQDNCDAKNGKACAKLGLHYLELNKPKKAVFYFKEACSLGIISACSSSRP